MRCSPGRSVASALVVLVSTVAGVGAARVLTACSDEVGGVPAIAPFVADATTSPGTPGPGMGSATDDDAAVPNICTANLRPDAGCTKDEEGDECHIASALSDAAACTYRIACTKGYWGPAIDAGPIPGTDCANGVYTPPPDASVDAGY